MITRDPAGRWTQGVSGNPLGLPGKVSEAVRLAKLAAAEASEAVIRRLVKLALADKTRPADVVTAGSAVLRASGVFDDVPGGSVGVIRVIFGRPEGDDRQFAEPDVVSNPLLDATFERPSNEVPSKGEQK